MKHRHPVGHERSVLARFAQLGGYADGAMSDELTVHTVGENLFEELGLSDAAGLQARVDLAFALTQEIRRRGLTQTRAAELLGISQPGVSKLMRGTVEGFSQERLGRLLNLLDLDIRIQVRPRAVGEARAGVRVEVLGTSPA